MTKRKTRSYLWLSVALPGIMAVWILFQLAMVVLLNQDLYGRLTETLTVGATSTTAKDRLPTIRIALHRLIAGENAIEADLLVILDDSELEEAIRNGNMTLTAALRDRSTVEPVELKHLVTVSAKDAEERFTGLAVRSDRFTIPVLPSGLGFPFDDALVMPMVNLRRPDGFDNQFNLEVQRALPGRLMRVSRDPLNPEITLTRTWSERTFVLLGGTVFIVLSIVIFISLMKSTVHRLDEFLAVAGYLVAAVGFRDLLGIPRDAGVSAFEVIVFGLPILLISVGIGISLLRGEPRAIEPSSV